MKADEVAKNVKHYLQFQDFSKEEHEYIFARTKELKRRFKNYETWHPLHDRTMAMIFEKSSTRTRLSFEAGMHQLGGHAIFLNTRDTQLGRGEPIEDSAQVVSRMTDIVMIRTFGQEIVERFAAHSRVPVINGLTNEYHPCQVSADIYTYIEERGDIAGKTVAWVGDANNMSYTWIQAARVLGFHLNLAIPAAYALDPKMITEEDKKHFTVCDTPMQACTGAHLVTTDVWISMGYEAENEARMKAFAGYKITVEMMAAAAPDAVFMHCLPAHRGEEVDAEVIDGPQSVVWQEAENRMHVQKAIMEYLLRGRFE